MLENKTYAEICVELNRINAKIRQIRCRAMIIALGETKEKSRHVKLLETAFQKAITNTLRNSHEIDEILEELEIYVPLSLNAIKKSQT
jgi:hypothetical protein